MYHFQAKCQLFTFQRACVKHLTEQLTLRFGADVIDYFKALAEETENGLPGNCGHLRVGDRMPHRKEFTMGKHGKRYTKEQREEAVRLVRETDLSSSQIARDLGMAQTTLARWVQQADIDEGRVKDAGLTTAEKQELRRLKREVKRLRQERDFLKKAAAFFAREDGNSTP